MTKSQHQVPSGGAIAGVKSGIPLFFFLAFRKRRPLNGVSFWITLDDVFFSLLCWKDRHTRDNGRMHHHLSCFLFCWELGGLESFWGVGVLWRDGKVCSMVRAIGRKGTEWVTMRCFRGDKMQAFAYEVYCWRCSV